VLLWFKIVSLLIPVINEFAVIAAKSPATGEQKRAAVLAAVQATFESLKASNSIKEIKAIDWADISGLIEVAITIVVSLSRAVGILK
jgi:hypothetical protein